MGEGTLRVSLRAPGIAWGQQMDAYLELGKRLDEFHLAPRDDRDVGAAVGELARERQAETLGAAADVAVLGPQRQHDVHTIPGAQRTLPAGLKWLLRLKRPIASAESTTARTAAATARGAVVTTDEMADASLSLSSALIRSADGVLL